MAAIRRSAERLSTLVDDLLALARAEEGLGGEEDDTSDATDAVTLVREACRHAEVEAQQRGLRFALDLPETLMTAVDGSAWLACTSTWSSNAVKFSLPDGEVRISLRAVRWSGRDDVRRRRGRDLRGRPDDGLRHVPAGPRVTRRAAYRGVESASPSRSGSSPASAAASTSSPRSARDRRSSSGSRPASADPAASTVTSAGSASYGVSFCRVSVVRRELLPVSQGRSVPRGVRRSCGRGCRA